MGAADGARVRHLVAREERPRAGPHTKCTRPAETRDELLALLEHLLDLGVGHFELVGIRDANIGGADHRDGPDRDDDVAVAGGLATVDHRVHEPVVHRDHDPLARQDGHAAAGELRDLAGPRAGCVDDDARADPNVVAAQLVHDTGADHLVSTDLEVVDAMVREDPGPVLRG